MADAQKTIDLIFNGVDRTGAATMGVLNNMNKFSTSLKDVTQPVSEFTIGAVKLEAGLLAAGLAMTVFAVKTAGDFSQSFAQINTLFDASAEDTAKFKNDIQEYASTSGKSFEDITGAINAAIGQGVKWSDALELISVAEKLAVATRADLTSTTSVLVGTTRAYGMETTDAAKVADMFFQTIKDGKIEMGDLSRSFAMISPLAKTAGVSLEETLSAIAVLTATSMPAGQAIEYLRSTLTNIIKPSKQASDMASDLGIQFDANALKSKGLAGVLDDVSRATKGSAGQMNILIGDAGGMVAAALLAKNGAKELKDELILMGNATGSVDVAFKKMSGEIDVVTQRVSNAFRALMITIGAPMLDEFGGIADAIAKIFLTLGKSVKDGELKGLAAYVEGVFGDIQKSLEQVAKNLPAALASADFSGFKGGIEAVLTAMKSMFSSFDITSVQGLKDVIELVGLAFLGLSKYVAGVIETFKPLFDTMVAVGRGAKDVDLSFLELAGNLGGIATQLNIVLPLFTGLLSILTVKQGLGVITELKSLPGILGGAAVGTTGLAGTLGAAGLAGAAGVAGYAVGGLVNDGISALLSKITGSKTTLGGFIYDLANGAESATAMAAGSKRAASGLSDLDDAANKSQDSFRRSEIAIQNTAEAADKSQDSFRRSEISIQNAAAATEKATGSTKGLADAQKSVVKYALETVPIFDALTGKISGYEQRLVASAKGTIDLGSASGKTAGDLSKITAETDKAKDATRKWNEEVSKMSFEEKLKLIDQQTKIMTTHIEADAKKAVAAFDSLSDSIKSTSDVLGKIFGRDLNFRSMSFAEERVVTEQIDKENKLRQAAFDLQKRLTEAQIEQMRAQTNALLKGDGLIKVSGDGLQPHLEAIMWELLQAIQIRVNKDGLKMLLGV